MDKRKTDLLYQVAVIGSVNMDIIVSSNRLPRKGETIFGQTVDYLIGGKGANQAVAAARSGGKVAFFGKVGQDSFGEQVNKILHASSIQQIHLGTDLHEPTGVAMIMKEPQDNRIIVISGANGLVDQSFVTSYQAEIDGAGTLLLQLEIPLTTVNELLIRAKSRGQRTIVNPAPFHEGIHHLLKSIDYLTPNETEFAQLIGKESLSDDHLESAMIEWQKGQTTRLIVTRGSLGVSYVQADKVHTIPSYEAKVVDTTGAGDTFNGVFAVKISEGLSVKEAIEWGNAAASLAVEKLGAQGGMANQEMIEMRFIQKKIKRADR